MLADSGCFPPVVRWWENVDRPYWRQRGCVVKEEGTMGDGQRWRISVL